MAGHEWKRDINKMEHWKSRSASLTLLSGTRLDGSGDLTAFQGDQFAILRMTRNTRRHTLDGNDDDLRWQMAQNNLKLALETGKVVGGGDAEIEQQ